MTFTAASSLDGTYPRPQLVREHWCDLGGEWGFAYDDTDAGRRESWFAEAGAGAGADVTVFDRTIVVPFPPESPASGIGDTGFHPVVWYRRTLTAEDVAAAGHVAAAGQGAGAGQGEGTRLILNFGAVDYRASVWVGGSFAGTHEGGGSPFSFDITDLLHDGADGTSVVVRAEDDPADLSQPRGKQDWQLEPHVIWYHRTTGIWQPVWLEAVPSVAIESIRWTPELVDASVHARVRFSRPAAPGSELSIALDFDGRALGRVTIPAVGREAEVRIPMPEQRNGQAYEHLLWSPAHPRLVDAVVTLTSGAGAGAGAVAVDTVHSYLGLRSAQVAEGRFLLNDRPFYVRSVLNQGYWPSTHLAATAEMLRAEAQLILDLGFNAARIHQKYEDPRFLFFADKLGLLVWGEAPAAYEFTPTAVNRTTTEWAAIVDRDYSHPSIVTWVPTNESWGVQHIAHDRRMRDYARALVHLTKALDPTRPVISNDGWEHVGSDILSIHDYESSGEVVTARYGSQESVDRMLAGLGPAGRRLIVAGDCDPNAPVMLTEFGGVSFVDRADTVDGAWGYSAAENADDFAARVGALIGAVLASPVLAGFCYTQLADTGQETNGLVTDARVPKLPVETIRRMVQGPHA